MLTFAALVAFMLITPGFVAVIGMRSASNHDLMLQADNTTTQILTLLISTTVIQLITFPICVWLGEHPIGIIASELLSKDATFGSFLLNGDKFHWPHWLFIEFYVIVTYLVSFVCGFILIWLVETGIVRTSLFHGALYELVLRNPPYLYCTVVSKLEYNGRSVMYLGILERIVYGENGKIEYVTLSQVEKFALKIGDEQITTFDKKQPVAYSKKNFIKNKKKKATVGETTELLYLQGADVANILFSEYDLKEPADLENLKKRAEDQRLKIQRIKEQS